jgi:hypothetical protein
MSAGLLRRLPGNYQGPINFARPLPDGRVFVITVGDNELNAIRRESRISLFGYTPSLALGAIALALYGLALIAHMWWIKRKGTRTFQILFAFSCVRPVRSAWLRAQSLIAHRPWSASASGRG